MVIIWEGTLNRITIVLSNNFESHSSETLICRCPRWIISDLAQLPCHKSEVFWRLKCSKWVMSHQMQLLCHNPWLLHRSPLWVSTYQDNHFSFFHFIIFYVSNFCMYRPFGFSVHRDALFCLSCLFRFATYRAFHINKVFLDCIGIHRTYKFVTIFCN